MSYQGFDFYSGIIVSEIQASPNLGGGVVLDYAATQFPSYPAVVVTPTNLAGEFADNTRNKDSFKFNVYVTASRLDREQIIEQALRLLTDDIIQRLQNNTTLNNKNNTYTKPITAQWGYASAPDPDMRSVTMTVEIIVGQ